MNALLQLIVPASLLFAAPADAPDRERGQKANKMQRHDADGSGTLSAAEVAGTKLEKRFATIDVDSDGELTMAEMRAAKQARKGDKKAREGKKARKGKQGERGDKATRKGSKRDGKQARKASRSGGKKAFAKRGQGRTDRKRFAQRGPKNAA